MIALFAQLMLSKDINIWIVLKTIDDNSLVKNNP